MKFKINRDHFSSGLHQVLNVVGARAAMPILNNVLIEAKGGEVFLTTTNLDLGIRCSIKANVGEDGAITLPVRKLATIVRELPSLDVTVSSGSDCQVKITSGGSSFRLMGIGMEEFPSLPEFNQDRSFVIDQQRFGAMLRNVAYAQSTDESRYILNGVLLRFGEGKVTLVATDGRRLALAEQEVEFPPEQIGQIIVPGKATAELMRLLDQGQQVKISFNSKQVAFDVEIDAKTEGLTGGIYLVSKLVEGNFPNYQQVIPKETHQRIKLDREHFLQCVHRAALVVSDKSSSVKLKVASNSIEITAASADLGEFHETLAIEYEGPDIQVAFNPQFIMDPLKALTKDVVFFELKNELSPGVFKQLDGFLCVIMPLRLN